MADRRVPRDAGNLTRRAYTLQPARSPGWRIAGWVTAGCLAVAAGGAAVLGWQALEQGGAAQTHCGEPLPEQAGETEIARARLALEQETAARTAVQKTADSAAAEVARLTAELQFLRGQSRPQAGARGR